MRLKSIFKIDKKLSKRYLKLMRKCTKPFLEDVSYFHTDAIAEYELMIGFVLKSFEWIYGKFSFLQKKENNKINEKNHTKSIYFSY